MTEEKSFKRTEIKRQTENSTCVSKTEETKCVQNEHNNNIQTKGIQAVVLQ